MMPTSKRYQSHFDIGDKNNVNNEPISTHQPDSNSLVHIPALFESLSKQIENLCVCATTASTGQDFNEDYSEYFGDMDLSRNSGPFASLHEDMYHRRMSGEYPQTIEEHVSGGVEEFKDQEFDDLIQPMPEDESTRIRNDFYQPCQSNWFASTALTGDDDVQMLMVQRKKAIAAWLRPRPNVFDPHSLPSGQSAFQLYDRPGDCRDSAIAIEELSEVQSVKKEKVQHAVGPYFFTNVDYYSRRQESDVIPPITTADTYTTVSLCHSMDSFMDSTDPYDYESEDDEDVILVDRESVANQVVSGCFRLSSPKSPPSTGTQGDLLISPPKLNNNRSLLRMTPQNYIHGDDHEDDRFFWSLAHSSKFSFLDSDAANPPPMMPELH